MKIRLFFTLIFCGTFFTLFAQHSSDYFEAGPDYVFFKALYSPRYLSASLSQNGTEIFNASPLRRDLVGIGLYGLGIGLEIYIPSPAQNQMEKAVGQEIDFTDIQGAVFLKKFTLEYGYQLHRGWVGKSTENQLYSKLFLRQTNIMPMYIFNGDKFTWKMMVNQSSRQIKSTGSFIIGSEIKFLKMKDDNFPDPNSLIWETSPMVSDWNGVIIWPGYAHNFVHNNFYLSLGTFAGGGIMAVDTYYDNQRSKGTESALALRWRAGIGYNDGTWLIGVLFQSQHNFLNGDLLDLQFDNQIAKFSVGYRFEAGPNMKKLRSQIPLLKSF